MTYLCTVFIDGEEWRSLIEAPTPPVNRLMTLGDTVITIRDVNWPSASSYGDFDENGWLTR